MGAVIHHLWHWLSDDQPDERLVLLRRAYTALKLVQQRGAWDDDNEATVATLTDLADYLDGRWDE